MNLHADVRAIRAVAPKWAKWLCCTVGGVAWWQNERGSGCFWKNSTGTEHRNIANILADSFSRTAICLESGSVHLQDELGKITEVPQSAWVAARRRTGRK